MKITSEKVFEHSKISLVNTRQNRFRDVHPKIENLGKTLLLFLSNKTLTLDVTDEIILNLVLKFRYAPAWLVEQWLETKQTIGSEEIAKTRIRTYIDFGLLYEYPSAIGIFLMPTNLTAGLFNTELGRFKDPSYNILTHEISELDILFKLHTGRLTFKCNKDCFPYVSHFFGSQNGSYALTEHDFDKSLNAFKGNGRNEKVEEISTMLHHLQKEIKEGKEITMQDIKLKKLSLYKKNNKGFFDVKIPDIAILAPRNIKNGIAYPESVALEVELVPKRVDAYEQALSIYWNNLVFGKVIYMVTNQNTLKNIKKAYAKLISNREPSCCFEIINYEIPYNKKEIL